MKLIGYARVSTMRQADEGHSLDAQHEAIHQWCRSMGHDLAGTMMEAASAATADRPVLAKCLASINDGRNDGIVVMKIDRLSRSVKDFAALVDEYDVFSVRDSFDSTTASGRMVAGMLAVFAQFERELISERVKIGMAAAKAKGLKVGRPYADDVTDKVADSIIESHRRRLTVKENARVHDVSVSTVKRLVYTR